MLTLSTLGSVASAGRLAAGMGMLFLLCGAPARAQPPSFPNFHGEFSTHDHTTTASSPTDLRETWNDVKTPGDGRTYAVGTIEVLTTDPTFMPRFSGEPVGLPQELAAFTKTTPRQIVLLQCSGRPPSGSGPNADQNILWQLYFYGETGNVVLEDELRSTNARGISVWAVLRPDGAPDDLETRIAICGETYDSSLPRSQFPVLNGWAKVGSPTGLTQYPIGLPSGFIAVFNGRGDLLWTHQFFFQDGGLHDPEGACAITDVSIRVEDTPQGRRDVVTYCGMSSFGDRTNDTIPPDITALTPFREFAAPGSTITGYVPAGGATDNGRGEWDGIVGRISNVHDGPTGPGTVKEFHAIVGGYEQDGSWGIVELTPTRFAVVGGTAVLSSTAFARPGRPPSSTSPMFPFSPNFINNQPVNWNAGQYAVGAVLLFDATQTRATTPGNLVLESSVSIGNVGEQLHTHAADISVQLDAVLGIEHRLAVAGTTNDAALFDSLWNNGPQPPPQPRPVIPAGPFAGPTDGFLATVRDLAPGLPPFHGGTFQGVQGNSGWSGVGVWNEYLDHLAVVGFEPASAQQDLAVASFLVDTPNGSPNPLPLRGGAVPSAPLEVPARMGMRNATAQEVVGPVPIGVGLDYITFDLGPPAGGGVAVDERARVNMVGATDAQGYPTAGGSLARTHRGGQDAIRTLASMLPVQVGRSDTSGEQTHNTVSIPQLTGTTGRTTPTCALLPLGRQVGVSTTGSTLPRMMIDWQGPAPGPTTVDPVHWVLVDRPRHDWSASMSVIQLGMATPTLPDTQTGIENWVPFGVTHSFQVSLGNPQSVRIPLLLPPAVPGTATFAMQVVTFLANPLTCTGQGVAASPAIVFSY